jgi:hypothetical protein
MTPSRFFKNLTGAVRRTFMRFPKDPIDAEIKYC